MGALIPKPDWSDEGGSFTPMPGGIFDGMPEQDQGSGLELLLSLEDMADIDSEGSGSGPGGGSEVPPHPLDKAAQDIASGVGKLWNLPNTAIGLAYGGLGMLAGEVGHGLGLQKDAPGISIGNNAVQFTDNPFIAPDAAITLGNAEVFGPREARDGRNTYGRHEEQHTYQGEQLGPFYLPSNALGGLAGIVMDQGDWHGPHNWNEVGPQQPTLLPWPK